MSGINCFGKPLVERFMHDLFGSDGKHAQGNFPKVVILGRTKHVTKCQNCGREGLKETVVCARVGEDGHPTRDYFYFGTDCASKIAGKSEKEVESEADAGDKKGRPRLPKPKSIKPNEGQQELALRFQAAMIASTIERFASDRLFDLDSPAPQLQEPLPVPSAIHRYPKTIKNESGRDVDAPPIYLSGSHSDDIAAAAAETGNLGLLVTPATRSHVKHLGKYPFFGVDNGCFSGQGNFDENRFYRLLDEIKSQGHAHKALFAAAPDVFDPVKGEGDWRSTLQRSIPHLNRIRAAGFPAAIVLQDGATAETIPWEKVDALFVGGSTGFKVGGFKDNPRKTNPEFIKIVREAKRRGVPLHYGRVNSALRLEAVHYGLGAHSVDGNFIKFSPGTNLQKVKQWLIEWGKFPEPVNQGTGDNDLLGQPLKPAPKPKAVFEASKTKQQSLFAGLNAKEGQMNLFADDGVPDDLVAKPQEPQQKELFDAVREALIERYAAKQSPWYFRSSQLLAQKMGHAAPADQVLAMLRNNQISPEEMKYTGLERHLLSKGNQPVSQQELQDLIGKFGISEKVLGEKKYSGKLRRIIDYTRWNESKGALHDYLWQLANQERKQGNHDLADEYLELADEALQNEKKQPSAKYRSYALPGGKNYREMLLTLPRQEKGIDWWYQNIHRPAAVSEMGGDESSVSENFDGYDENAKQDLQEMYQDWQKKQGDSSKSGYLSRHWDVPDVLAHVRYQDMISPDGKKHLHVEEIQSDWHQKGAKQGYYDPEKANRKLEDLSRDELKQILIANDRNGDFDGVSRREALQIIRNWQEEDPGFDVGSFLRNRASTDGVPDAPFKKNWHALAMKRILHHAAANGYDRVTWTPGQEQADRYNLSRHVHSVSYRPETSKFLVTEKGGQKVLQGKVVNGKYHQPGHQLHGSPLDDIIGGELTGRLLNSKPGRDGWVSLSGDGLSFGGEFHKTLYDQKLPEVAHKLIKPHGGMVRQFDLHLPEVGDSEGYDPGHVPARSVKVHGFDITPQLRQSVIGKGQSLFSVFGDDDWSVDRYGTAPESNRWYLKSLDLLSQKMGSMAPASQVLSMLKNNQVSPEELKWTGLERHLLGKGNQPVSQQELRDLVGRFNVDEKILGDRGYSDKLRKFIEETGWRQDIDGPLHDYIWKMGTEAFRAKLHDKADEFLQLGNEAWEKRQTDNEPKYASYALPGGKNYREMLLTLPVKPAATVENTTPDAAAYEKYKDQWEQAKSEWERVKNTPGSERDYHEQAMNQIHHLMAIDTFNRRSIHPLEGAGQFHHPHWDEAQNVLAHVRYQDFIGPDGKKHLHIDEIQSDWHQEGRKKGYAKPRWTDAEERRVRELEEPRPYPGLTGAERQEWQDLIRKTEVPGVPDAPFKNNWHMLVMKRMMHHAAANGYDRVTWTPGEEHVSRYGLQKHLRAIHHDPYTGKIEAIGADGYGKPVLSGYLKDGKFQSGLGGQHEEFHGKELSDIFGREIAEKITSHQGRAPLTITGEGLKVGGSGMRKFYDQMLPNDTSKLIKKHGGKVGQFPLHLPSETGTKKLQVHGFDITPQMRQSVLSKGQSLFSLFDDDSLTVERYETLEDVQSELGNQHPPLHMFASERPTEIHLHDLQVAKESRGQGIGRKVLERLKEYAQKVGKPITLTASPDPGKKGALDRFYKSNGFQKPGRKRDYRLAAGHTHVWRPEPDTDKHSAENEPKPVAAAGQLDSHIHWGMPEFKTWFGSSKAVTPEGKPLRLFHGTKRPDRIGAEFKASRATSGPMAFFTDDPEIASNYATGKQDTSLDMPESYSHWFKYKAPGSRREVDLDSAWHHLPMDQRKLALERLPHVNLDDEGNISHKHGQGTVADDWDYYLKREGGGNPIKAARYLWLDSGHLFNDEHRFLEVLKHAGLDTHNFRMESPWHEQPGVYPVWLSIQNPLDTASIPDRVHTALHLAGRLKRGKAGSGADQWDKRHVSGPDWLERLSSDRHQGTTHAWTSIPDWVTKTLKSFGYDGIRDRGGKYNHHGHNVWIPFSPHQIKSAVGNRGTFSLGSRKIIYASEGHPERFQAPARNQHGFVSFRLGEGIKSLEPKAPQPPKNPAAKMFEAIKSVISQRNAAKPAETVEHQKKGPQMFELELSNDWSGERFGWDAPHEPYEGPLETLRETSELTVGQKVARQLLGNRATGVSFREGYLPQRKARRQGSIIGKQLGENPAKHHLELAKLVQRYRDRRYETFRAIYLRENKVVGVNAISMRHPSLVSIGPHTSKIYEDAHHLGADKVWLVHNHPSGNASPSDADHHLTRQMHERFEDWNKKVKQHGIVHQVNLAGHIVTNHDHFTHFEPLQGPGDYHRVDLKKPGPSLLGYVHDGVQHHRMGQNIRGPEDVAQMARNIHHNPHQAVVALVNVRHQLRALLDIDAKHLTHPDPAMGLKTLGALRRMHRKLGTVTGFLFLPEGMKPEHINQHLRTHGAFLDMVEHGSDKTFGMKGNYQPSHDLMDVYERSKHPLVTRKRAVKPETLKDKFAAAWEANVERYFIGGLLRQKEGGLQAWADRQAGRISDAASAVNQAGERVHSRLDEFVSRPGTIQGKATAALDKTLGRFFPKSKKLPYQPISGVQPGSTVWLNGEHTLRSGGIIPHMTRGKLVQETDEHHARVEIDGKHYHLPKKNLYYAMDPSQTKETVKRAAEQFVDLAGNAHDWLSDKVDNFDKAVRRLFKRKDSLPDKPRDQHESLHDRQSRPAHQIQKGDLIHIPDGKGGFVHVHANEIQANPNTGRVKIFGHEVKFNPEAENNVEHTDRQLAIDGNEKIGAGITRAKTFLTSRLKQPASVPQEQKDYDQNLVDALVAYGLPAEQAIEKAREQAAMEERDRKARETAAASPKPTQPSAAAATPQEDTAPPAAPPPQADPIPQSDDDLMADWRAANPLPNYTGKGPGGPGWSAVEAWQDRYQEELAKRKAAASGNAGAPDDSQSLSQLLASHSQSRADRPPIHHLPHADFVSGDGERFGVFAINKTTGQLVLRYNGQEYPTTLNPGDLVDGKLKRPKAIRSRIHKAEAKKAYLSGEELPSHAQDQWEQHMHKWAREKAAQQSGGVEPQGQGEQAQTPMTSYAKKGPGAKGKLKGFKSPEPDFAQLAQQQPAEQVAPDPIAQQPPPEPPPAVNSRNKIKVDPSVIQAIQEQATQTRTGTKHVLEHAILDSFPGASPKLIQLLKNHVKAHYASELNALGQLMAKKKSISQRFPRGNTREGKNFLQKIRAGTDLHSLANYLPDYDLIAESLAREFPTFFAGNDRDEKVLAFLTQKDWGRQNWDDMFFRFWSQMPPDYQNYILHMAENPDQFEAIDLPDVGYERDLEQGDHWMDSTPFSLSEHQRLVEKFSSVWQTGVNRETYQAKQSNPAADRTSQIKASLRKALVVAATRR